LQLSCGILCQRWAEMCVGGRGRTCKIPLLVLHPTRPPQQLDPIHKSWVRHCRRPHDDILPVCWWLVQTSSKNSEMMISCICFAMRPKSLSHSLVAELGLRQERDSYGGWYTCWLYVVVECS